MGSREVYIPRHSEAPLAGALYALGRPQTELEAIIQQNHEVAALAIRECIGLLSGETQSNTKDAGVIVVNGRTLLFQPPNERLTIFENDEKERGCNDTDRTLTIFNKGYYSSRKLETKWELTPETSVAYEIWDEDEIKTIKGTNIGDAKLIGATAIQQLRYLRDEITEIINLKI